jgi:uncharacterized membrane protein YhaH (DUF805 family)
MSENWVFWRLIPIAAASIPLLAAMHRRLQDVGENGQQAFYPFSTILIIWLGYRFLLGFGLLVGGPILLFLVALLLFVPMLVIAITAGAIVTSNIVGMMLIASEPGVNQFGPPNGEVSI